MAEITDLARKVMENESLRYTRKQRDANCKRCKSPSHRGKCVGAVNDSSLRAVYDSHGWIEGNELWREFPDTPRSPE